MIFWSSIYARGFYICTVLPRDVISYAFWERWEGTHIVTLVWFLGKGLSEAASVSSWNSDMSQMAESFCTSSVFLEYSKHILV